MLYGSYENLELLRSLHMHGLKLNPTDKAGKTPLDYAREQTSGVLASYLS